MRRFLLFTLIVFVISGQATHASPKPAKAAEMLEAMGIIPYPEQSQSKLPSDLIKVQPLQASEIDLNFTNLDDLTWLKPIATKNRVFLFGENHYFRVTHQLALRMFLALNTFDHYSLITTEVEFSVTPFFDHYIHLSDDREAATFREKALSPFLTDEETSELLETLRRWNLTHPDKAVHIAAHDLEHGYNTTLHEVLEPYFRFAKIDCPIPPGQIGTIELGQLVDKLQRCVDAAKAAKAIGNYPFLTPTYIDAVVQNLKSTWLAKYYQFEYYRQHAIIRNLTDPAFLGTLWQDGKLFLYGGGYHTPNHFPYPDGGNFYREGSYLTYDYEPTRGKTYSVYVEGFAYSMEGMAGANLDKYNHVGSGYQNLIETFSKAQKVGLVTPAQFYFYNWEMDDFDGLLLKHAKANGHAPLLLTSIDWDGLITNANKVSPKLVQTIRRHQDEFTHYDAMIVVPRSPITRARRKPLPLPAGQKSTAMSAIK